MRRAAMISLLFVSIGCQKEQPVVNLPPPDVVVALPLEENITPTATFNGEIKALQSIEVRARIRGHLVKVCFQDGADVKKGDLLFEIDPRPYKAAFDQAEAQKTAAEAQLKLATAEYNRIKELANKRAASREELDVASGKQAVSEAEVGKTKAEVERAQLDLDWTKIHADMDGRISRTYVDVGNLVNAGGGDTLLTRIVSIDPIYAYFKVDERVLIRAREEEGNADKPVKELKIPVELTLTTGDVYPYKGVIDFAENQMEKSTGTIGVRALMPNPKGFLTPGMFVRVRVPKDDPRKVLLVDETAICNEQNLKYLLTVNDKNEVVRNNVTLGPSEGRLRSVISGLSPTDKVIISGIQFVRPGIKVTPKDGKMPAMPTKKAKEPEKSKEPKKDDPKKDDQDPKKDDPKKEDQDPS